MGVFTTPGPVLIFPGETKTIVDITPYDINQGLQILLMGVSQHPLSTFIYSADGHVIQSPVPLGEFHEPIMTCRDLGAYIDVTENFRIAVRNNDSISHYYAGVVWFISRRR